MAEPDARTRADADMQDRVQALVELNRRVTGTDPDGGVQWCVVSEDPATNVVWVRGPFPEDTAIEEMRLEVVAHDSRGMGDVRVRLARHNPDVLGAADRDGRVSG